MQDIDLIAALSDAFGPSGFEDDVLSCVRRFARRDADLKEDSLRNLYLYPQTNRGDRPVVMLDAHSDEVGFMVQAVRPNGTLKLLPLGGWVNSNIPAHRFKVRTWDGQLVTGVTAAKPPHFMTAEERNRMPSLEEISLDVGASSPEEVRALGIGPGSPVAPDVRFEYDGNRDLMIGKALDNRLGCAAMLSILRAVGEEDLKVDVVGAIASQEEMGTRGASVTARRVRPRAAIVLEGSPADDTVAESWMIQTAVRRGPMLRHLDNRMITNPRFQRFALDLAREEGIPVQEAVRSGGSTDGAPIHLSGEGIPCIVIGFPVRYIHSHYGIASLEDFLNGVKLASRILCALDADVIASF